MSADLNQKIIRQIEYYFSDVNLARDKFMQEELKKDDGWLPLEVLTRFNRLKVLSSDIDEIVTALKDSKSGLLEIDEANKKIKRAQPLPEDLSEVEAALKQNTVYVKGFPETLTLDELIAFFEQYGKVSKIFMRRFPTTKAFKGKVFVTFSTAEEVKAMLDVQELKYNDTKLETETQEAYVARKGTDIGQRKTRKEKKDEESEASILENIKRGTAMHIKGLNENCTREDLRELFDNYKVIRWVNYMKGQPEAHLRFAEENDAKVALEEILKAKDGSVELKGSKLEIRLLEGDEELEYLKKELKEEGSRMSSSARGRRQKGGRGGHGGHRKNNGNFNKNKRKNGSRDGKASDGEENEKRADKPVGDDDGANKKLKTVN